MRITKQDVLKAIKTEKLKNGRWITEKTVFVKNSMGDEVRESILDNTCAVCAVGAVLRQKGVPNQYIQTRADDFFFYSYEPAGEVGKDGDELQALKNKNYLSALSIKFEKLANRLGNGQRTRTQLTKFVKDNFPKQFNVKL